MKTKQQIIDKFRVLGTQLGDGVVSKIHHLSSTLFKQIVPKTFTQIQIICNLINFNMDAKIKNLMMLD